ncbi:MAG: sigma-70 family RNA polymerase sigma factor, partial [Vallitalea sp.]|nr:sigma-70 family RNA polymerase sigma factor [Vallitalea sp.]
MIKDLIMDAKTDKDSMYVLIKQFEPLIDKYSRLLNYEEARTDLIIAFIELIHKIPCLETPKNISYINKSIKNTYIRFSKSNN